VFEKNIFGQYLFLKKLMIRSFAVISFPRFNYINKPVIKGAELIPQLENRNVLFVSNHQTYFADAAFMFHVFESALDGHANEIWLRSMLKCPFPHIYFVAAEETMKAGILPKLMGYAGAISIKRTWRESGKNIKREVDENDTESIKKALDSGWVITFPQGTTKPFADGRKGTAHIIKNYKPIVVPIVVNGFRRAFDKKGLFLKKKGTKLEITIKEPLDIDYEDNVDNILYKVMDSIEQSEKYEWRSKN
jgi:1-acyl-sn-glycerol-3-phosphate acyltransferase